MRLCSVRDVAGMEALHTRHSAACLSLARRTLRDRQHAEDAVQEAFLDLWRQADAFDPGRTSPVAWLLHLTYRRSIDRLRSEGRRRTTPWTEGHDQRAPVGGAGDSTLGTRDAADVRRAVSRLPSGQADVLSLVHWGGLSLPEVATALNIPLGTAKTRARNGMITLGVALTLADPETPRERSRQARARHRATTR